MSYEDLIFFHSKNQGENHNYNDSFLYPLAQISTHYYPKNVLYCTQSFSFDPNMCKLHALPDHGVLPHLLCPLPCLPLCGSVCLSVCVCVCTPGMSVLLLHVPHDTRLLTHGNHKLQRQVYRHANDDGADDLDDEDDDNPIFLISQFTTGSYYYYRVCHQKRSLAPALPSKHP